MTLNKKIALPLLILAVAAAAAGGWLYSNGWFKKDGHGHSKLEHAVQQYTCSMHPFIVKDKPGTCPICGMELIKKIDSAPADGGQSPEQKQQADMLGHVSLSPTQRVMANVATITAFMVCILFSACSNTIESGLSNTSSVTSIAVSPNFSCISLPTVVFKS